MREPARYIPVLALVAIAAGAAMAWCPWDAACWMGFSRVSGWVAAALLLATLAASPFGRDAPPKEVTRWRRALGIGAGVTSLIHLGIGVAGPLRDGIDALWSWPTYRAGLLATLVLTLLLLTSFPATSRRVKVWKPLHRLSYIAAGLVALHLLRLPFASLIGVLLFGSVLVVLLGWRIACWVLERRAERAEPI